jgi:hypothetical protein
MLLPRVRPAAVRAAGGSGVARGAKACALLPHPPPRAHARARGAALVAAAKRTAAPPAPSPADKADPPLDDDEEPDATPSVDFQAVVKLHCTSMDPDWVNPWQARRCAAPRPQAVPHLDG